MDDTTRLQDLEEGKVTYRETLDSLVEGLQVSFAYVPAFDEYTRKVGDLLGRQPADTHLIIRYLSLTSASPKPVDESSLFGAGCVLAGGIARKLFSRSAPVNAVSALVQGIGGGRVGRKAVSYVQYRIEMARLGGRAQKEIAALYSAADELDSTD